MSDLTSGYHCGKYHSAHWATIVMINSKVILVKDYHILFSNISNIMEKQKYIKNHFH